MDISVTCSKVVQGEPERNSVSCLLLQDRCMLMVLSGCLEFCVAIVDAIALVIVVDADGWFTQWK